MAQDAPSGLAAIENVFVGPIIAVLSFVCSVGNVPLAAVLWSGGISFAGVLAFLFADLIAVRKDFGGETFYFCSEQCPQSFEVQAERDASSSALRSDAAATEHVH